MASRAVQFIREQATKTKQTEHLVIPQTSKPKNVANRVAGLARKIKHGETTLDKSVSPQRPSHELPDIYSKENPKQGWSNDVQVKNGHYMLLLKPQIALRSEGLDSDVIAVGKLPFLTFSGEIKADHISSPYCLPS